MCTRNDISQDLLLRKNSLGSCAHSIFDLPREKIARLGASALSDEELLAIVFGSGTKAQNVFSLARSALKVIDERGSTLTLYDLKQVTGLGPAKSAVVLAALEFSRRRIHEKGIRIREAADVFPLLSYLGERKQEHFICISLNGAHEVLASRIVTVGLLNSCQVHPREVLSDPLIDRAASIIIAHNHPSGDLTPSQADIVLTERLYAAAEMMGIKLLDHIIFSSYGFQSMAESGVLKIFRSSFTNI